MRTEGDDAAGKKREGKTRKRLNKLDWKGKERKGKRRKEKEREGKRREEKRREEKGREGKRRKEEGVELSLSEVKRKKSLLSVGRKLSEGDKYE